MPQFEIALKSEALLTVPVVAAAAHAAPIQPSSTPQTKDSTGLTQTTSQSIPPVKEATPPTVLAV